MRYPASEKLEIIRIVERSHVPARRTLEQLGIPRATFHRFRSWRRTEDRSPQPGRVWNRIPETVRIGSELALSTGAVAAGTGDVH
jgi:transposase-like protein